MNCTQLKHYLWTEIHCFLINIILSCAFKLRNNALFRNIISQQVSKLAAMRNSTLSDLVNPIRTTSVTSQ